MRKDPPRPKPRFFYGWYIVAGVFFANWVGGGFGTAAFGLFFKPMSSELGWTRSMTTVPLVLRSALSSLAGPLVGPLVDRIGPRYLMTGGALVVGAGTMLMSQTHSLWQFFLFFALIGALGEAGLGSLVTNTTVARWFVRQRGRATGIAAVGINVGQATMTALIHLLIAALGWRRTWAVIGLVPWLVIAPTSFLWMRRAPEDLGLRPDGDASREAGQAQNTRDARRYRRAAEEHPWTPREAMGTPALWLLLAAITLSSLAVHGVVVHQIPFLTDQGLSPGVAALSLTLYALFAIPSKLLWGFLAERVPLRYLTAACFLGSAGGVVILIQADTVWEAVAFGVVYGFTRGSWVVVVALIWADYFGRRFLGSIRGYVAPIDLIAGLGGPLFAALAYDSTQSYRLAFSLFAAAYVLAGALVLLARQPAPPTAAPA
jgi:sugar phosphate permease